MFVLLFLFSCIATSTVLYSTPEAQKIREKRVFHIPLGLIVRGARLLSRAPATRSKCRVTRLVDYVGNVPRFWCDCPPIAPNYQYYQCFYGSG
ncbi:unnamed protein product [Caenorhabditis angaria]|uniref:Secreted protein n=1 Tax=Caenorhabditis angaria TaxID=860376 RepID=A0A9P1IEU5_9PELO|nr:unnamed protein product [Caenorhabditis angaria]